jgi:DNA primase
VDALFERERARAPLTTPEAKSGLRKRLRDAAGRIGDPDTARLYREELTARADALLARPKAGPSSYRNGQRWTPPIAATAELRPIAAPGQRRLAVEALLRLAIDAPGLIGTHAELFAALPLADRDLKAIQNAALEVFIHHGTVDRKDLSRHLTDLGEMRAVARLSHWPQALTWGQTETGSSRDPKTVEAEWVMAAEREAAAPGIKDEIAALRAQGDLDTDDEAFAHAVKVLEDVREADRRRAPGGDGKDEDAA